MQTLVETDLDGGQVIAPATDRKSSLRDLRIARGKEAHDLRRRQGDLRRDAAQFGWNHDRMKRLARCREVIVRRKSGAGAVSLPFVLEQPRFGIHVTVLRRIGGSGSVGTVVGIGAVVVLRPQAVHDKGRMGRALRSRRVRVAVLRRPGEIQ